ncbi:AAA family ATPase [Iocasia frigidifontis]|uniref:AAA family ATPase n=1 Tax=Iocasia fonsfrigidae TaxID=2682810 RepID=A0A8A7KD63_9FIRM|nr:AAA family ATPase [Iocasia fonsfrigidae]QTL99716.1 AAA family ATPase [Iocasia fonsfrigidae]
MKIPYGISDFKSLRKESYLYVDKTNVSVKYNPHSLQPKSMR